MIGMLGSLAKLALVQTLKDSSWKRKPVIVDVPTAAAGAGAGRRTRRVVVVADFGRVVRGVPQHQVVVLLNARLRQRRGVGHVVRPAGPHLVPHRNVRDGVHVRLDGQNVLRAGKLEVQDVAVRDVDVQRVRLLVLRGKRFGAGMNRELVEYISKLFH